MEEESTDPSSLVIIGNYESRAPAEEHGLVVIAMQMACWILKEDGGKGRYALAVEADHAARAGDEIRAYQEESIAGTDEVGRPLPSFRAGRWLAFFYAAILFLCYNEQGRRAEFEPSLISDNHAIIEGGETYRAATALLLHADEFHLLGNVIFGIGFGLLVAASIGGITGWILIVIAGFLGNLINAHHYYPVLHRSLGASTAVFGALGILTGYGIIAAFLSPRSAPWARAILPIAGGFALLGWFGLGGPEVDIMAHVYGFAVGIPLGFVAGWLRIAFATSEAAGASVEI